MHKLANKRRKSKGELNVKWWNCFAFDTLRLLLAVTAGAVIAMSASAEQPDTWLDYVEARSNLFVDTGVVAKKGTKVEYRGTYGSPNPASPNRDILIGASAGGDTSEWGIIRNNNAYISLSYNNNSIAMRTDVVFPPSADTMFTIVSEVTLNGSLSNIRVSGADNGFASGTWSGENLTQTLYLFARNANGSADKFSRGKCYGLCIWQVPDGGSDYVLVRDYKPCIKNGVAGLYDTVNDTITYSGAANALSAGNEIEFWQPSEWLEYVQAERDHAQYIDTGVIAKRGTKIEYRGTYSGAGRATLIGVNGAPELVGNLDGYIGNGIVHSSIAFPGNKDETEIQFTIAAEWCPASVAVGNGYRISVSDGTETSEAVGRGWSDDTAYTMYLFGGNNKDGTVNVNNPAYGKCRGLKIWQIPDGGTEYVLVRDLKPCRSGDPGLFDTVTRTLYRSRAAKAFISGPVLASAGKPDKYLEYVEATSDGVQHLDTGVTGRKGTKIEYCGTYGASPTSASILAGASAEMFWFTMNDGGWISGCGRTHTSLSNPPNANEVFTIESEISTNAIPYISVVSDVHSASATGSQKSTSDKLWRSIYLFGRNDSGRTQLDRRGWGKCRNLKVWQVPEGGTEYVLVRDYRPCMKDGAVGMYDSVAKQVYLPSAGTTFLAGPEIPQKGLMLIVK